MPLIKADNSPRTLQAFSLTDIERHAAKIIANARREAQQILEAAQLEAEQLKVDASVTGFAEGQLEGEEKGRQEGLELGRREAFAAAEQQLVALADTLEMLLTTFDADRQALAARASAEVTHLALAIARKVCHSAGLNDPAVASDNVEQAVRMVVHASQIRLAIHPSRLELVEALLPELKRRWPTLHHVELAADESIAPGGCRLFTTGGLVDADLDTQLDRITADLVPQQPL